MAFIELDPVIANLQSLQDHVPNSDFDDGFNNGIFSALSILEVRPKIDAEVRLYGEWKCPHVRVVKDDDSVRIISAKCSMCCEYAEQISYNQNQTVPSYPRCPHCGAIMKENYERTFWTDNNSESQKPDYNYNPPETNRMFNYD